MEILLQTVGPMVIRSPITKTQRVIRLAFPIEFPWLFGTKEDIPLYVLKEMIA